MRDFRPDIDSTPRAPRVAREMDLTWLSGPDREAVRVALGQGDLEGALDLLEAERLVRPEDADVERGVEAMRRAVEEEIVSRMGGYDLVPVRVKPIPAGPDRKDGMLVLGDVNGVSTVGDILSIALVPRLRAARLLEGMLESGTLHIAGGSRRPRRKTLGDEILEVMGPSDRATPPSQVSLEALLDRAALPTMPPPASLEAELDAERRNGARRRSETLRREARTTRPPPIPVTNVGEAQAAQEALAPQDAPLWPSIPPPPPTPSAAPESPPEEELADESAVTEIPDSDPPPPAEPPPFPASASTPAPPVIEAAAERAFSSPVASQRETVLAAPPPSAPSAAWSPRLVTAVALAVAVIAASAAVVITRASVPAAAPTTIVMAPRQVGPPAPSAKSREEVAPAPADPTEIRVRAEVLPRTARLWLDDVPMPTAEVSIPRDGQRHVLRAEAQGFHTRRTTFTAERDLVLVISLDQLPPRQALPAAPAGPAPPTDQAPPPEQPPPAAPAPTAEPPPLPLK